MKKKKLTYGPRDIINVSLTLFSSPTLVLCPSPCFIAVLWWITYKNNS
jgi:hypothetical protein